VINSPPTYRTLTQYTYQKLTETLISYVYIYKLKYEFEWII